jgi:hypothetical protein
MSLGTQRVIVEECMKCVPRHSLGPSPNNRLFRWANQRMIFGKRLNAQAVVRSKLARMIARIESGQNWLEMITHQMNNVGSSDLYIK